MSSGPDTPPLQFDTVVPSLPVESAAEATGVRCVTCQQLLVDEYFDVNGQAVCATCKETVSEQAQTPAGAGPLLRAAGLGIVAAILGAVVYYGVIALTDLEIGIVAIAIGFMVGYGIRLGTKGRGGRRFQVLAVVLTYWAVGLAYTPLVFEAATSAEQQQTQDGAQAAESTASATPDAGDATANDAGGGVSFGYALLVLFGLTFALPVLTVVSSMPGGLLSAAIIAFGMQQAWKMTGAPQLAISGPYRVGGVPAATS